MSKKHQGPNKTNERHRPQFSVKAIIVVFGAVSSIALLLHFAGSSPTGNVVGASSPAVVTAGSSRAFLPTAPNRANPPAHTPKGMVWIPGGEFSMGAMDPAATTETAMHGAA